MLKEELGKVLNNGIKTEEKYLKSLLKRTIIKISLLNKEKNSFKIADIAAYANYLISANNGEYPSSGNNIDIITPKIQKVKNMVENYEFFINAKKELIQKIKDLKCS